MIDISNTNHIFGVYFRQVCSGWCNFQYSPVSIRKFRTSAIRRAGVMGSPKSIIRLLFKEAASNSGIFNVLILDKRVLVKCNRPKLFVLILLIIEIGVLLVYWRIWRVFTRWKLIESNSWEWRGKPTNSPGGNNWRWSCYNVSTNFMGQSDISSDEAGMS